MSNNLIIAGDVSATNIEMGIYKTQEKHSEPETLFEANYKGQETNDFNDIIDDLLAKTGKKRQDIDRMVLSPAGPISPDRKSCKLTNAPFTLDLAQLGSPGTLVNDFAAIGYAISKYGNTIPHVDLTHITGYLGQVIEGEPMAIIGSGTGHGQGRLFYDKEKGLYFPQPAEGGHKFLAVDVFDDKDIEIAQWLAKYHGEEKPHLEAALSGPGIVNTFKYFLCMLPEEERVLHRNALRQQEDKGAYIAGQAKLHPESIYGQTMGYHWKHTGMALHDSAVQEVARGGVWIAGGIIRKNILNKELSKDGAQIVDHKIEEIIVENFDRTPSHAIWLQQIPIKALTANVGRRGALAVATTNEYWEREYI